MITFETSTRIHRPIEDVFAYVSEPRNFPRWNSAVEAVRKTSAGDSGVASTYLLERALPSGRAVNELEVVTRESGHASSRSERRQARHPSATATGSPPRTTRPSCTSRRRST